MPIATLIVVTLSQQRGLVGVLMPFPFNILEGLGKAIEYTIEDPSLDKFINWGLGLLALFLIIAFLRWAFGGSSSRGSGGDSYGNRGGYYGPGGERCPYIPDRWWPGQNFYKCGLCGKRHLHSQY